MRKKKASRMKERILIHKMSCLREEFRNQSKEMEQTYFEMEEYQKEVRNLYETKFKDRANELRQQMHKG